MWLNNLSTPTLCVVVFVSQILFIFFRTINVIYTSERNYWVSAGTSVAIHLCWLLSITIGVKSIMSFDGWVILASAIGGASGTCLGIRFERLLSKYWKSHASKKARIE